MKNEFVCGARNQITDVAGVRVGHKTIETDTVHTGVTVVIPTADDVFCNKPTAACYVLNGYGKSVGLVQIEELGTLESPIALTNTLSVGAVLDALAKRAVRTAQANGRVLHSVNSVVCECNDALISDICAFSVSEQDVSDAFEAASDTFEEGAVGAGRGMSCHGLKGGIGSASRMVTFDSTAYTVGVLLLSNHGTLSDLTVEGRPIGREIAEGLPENDQGSVIVLLATDIPLTSRQLKRVIKRIPTALARAGSRIGHSSGEIFIGFSTANRVREDESCFATVTRLSESKIDTVFRAASEATENALYKSMRCAEPCLDQHGKPVHSLSEFE